MKNGFHNQRTGEIEDGWVRGETRGRTLRTLDFIGYRRVCPQSIHPEISRERMLK